MAQKTLRKSSHKALGCFLLLLPSLALAKDPVSGVELKVWMPWTQLQSSISRATAEYRNFNYQAENQKLNFAEYQSLVPQFRAQVFGLETLQSQIRAGSFSIESKGLRLVLDVPSFHIDQEIVRESGGATLRVRVKADCGPIRLSQGFQSLRAAYDFSFEQLKFSGALKSFELEPLASDFSLADIQCAGVSGLDQVIQKKLTEYLSSKEFLSAQLQSLIDPVLLKLLSGQMNQLTQGMQLPPSAASASATEKIVLQSLDQNDVGLEARLVWYFDSLSNAEVLKLSRSALPSESAELQMSKEALQFLIQKYISAQPEWREESANKYQAFQQLLNSKIVQFFVWPDLLQFSKKSLFSLFHHRPQIQQISVQNQTIDLLAKLGGWLKTERSGKIWNYLSYSSNLQSELVPEVVDGNLRLSFQNIKLDLEIRFGQDYVIKFQPRQWIAQTIFKKVLMKDLENKTWQISLPSLKIGNEQILSLKSISQQQESVSFGF